VQVEDGAGNELRWDENCTDGLPEQLWATMLRPKTEGVLDPQTVEEGRTFRQQETQAVLASRQVQHNGPREVTEDTRMDTAMFMQAMLGEGGSSGNSLDQAMGSDRFQLHGGLLCSDPSELSSPALALADLAGRSAAVDAGVHLYLRQKGLEEAAVDPPTALDACSWQNGADAIEELRRMPPVLRTFLWRFASTRYRPVERRQQRSAAVFHQPDDDGALAARALGLLPVFAMLFATHGDYSDLTKLSSWQRRFTVALMMDGGGLAEKTLGTLKGQMRAVTSARSARRDIQGASLALRSRAVLTENLSPQYQPRAEDTPVICESVDNANVKRDNKEQTKLGCGSTFCGWSLSPADVDTIKAEMPALPQPDRTTVRMQALSPTEEAVLDRQAAAQDVQALTFAAATLAQESRPSAVGATPQPRVRPSTSALRVGNAVTFADGNGHRHHGQVVAVLGETQVTVRIEHGDGCSEDFTGKPGTFHMVVAPAAAAPASAIATAATSPVAGVGAHAKRRRVSQLAEDTERLAMDCDADGRERGCPCPTWLNNVLHDVNSKHHHAAKQGLDAMKEASDMPILLAQVTHSLDRTWNAC
jgi:hypothetical protein